MKNILSFALILTLGVSITGCYDDSEIWEAINKNSEDISELKELCRQMNSDIKNLQTLVVALENADYITNVSPLADGSGYSITMRKYGTIVIKNGEKGADGTNGENGQDGKAPVISVAKDKDGLYYWTIDGEWLKDTDGNKVRAIGVDGKDGENGLNGSSGIDGKTPQFDIRDGYWYISYDGEHWDKLGRASGENADVFFTDVSIEDGLVIITLNDGKDTQIRIPYIASNQSDMLINRIQSITFIPKYSDGKVRLNIIEDNDNNYRFSVDADFDIRPKSIVEELIDNKSILSGEIILTSNRNGSGYEHYDASISDIYLGGNGEAHVTLEFDNISKQMSIGVFPFISLNATGEDYSVKSSFIPVNIGIFFEDPETKKLLVSKYDIDEDGELSIWEAQTMTSLAIQSDTITSFQEFRYFTSITTLSTGSISSCSLRSLILPPSITTIQNNAIEILNNTSFEFLVLPESLTYIDRKLIWGGGGLPINIYLKAKTPPKIKQSANSSDGLFGYISADNNKPIFYVPKQSLTSYRENNSWNKYNLVGFDYENNEIPELQ